jgi:HSF-type DNA-binding
MIESSSMSSHSDIIRWLPHGRAFRFYDKERLVNELLPRYLKRQTKFASFQRQLNMYGFLKLTGDHADKGGYYHPLFLRGRPALSKLIFRNDESESKVRRKWDSTTEPDFSQMPPITDVILRLDVEAAAPMPPMCMGHAAHLSGNNSHTSSSQDMRRSSTLPQLSPLWSLTIGMQLPVQQSHFGYYQCHHPESAPASLGTTSWLSPPAALERVTYSTESHGYDSYPEQTKRFRRTLPAFLESHQPPSNLSTHDQVLSPLKLGTGTTTSSTATLSPTMLACHLPSSSLVPRCLPPSLEQLAQFTESQPPHPTAPVLPHCHDPLMHFLDGCSTNRPLPQPGPSAASAVSLDSNDLRFTTAQRKRKNDDSWWPDIADHSLHDDGDLALDCGSMFSDAESANETFA